MRLTINRTKLRKRGNRRNSATKATSPNQFICDSGDLKEKWINASFYDGGIKIALEPLQQPTSTKKRGILFNF